MTPVRCSRVRAVAVVLPSIIAHSRGDYPCALSHSCCIMQGHQHCVLVMAPLSLLHSPASHHIDNRTQYPLHNNQCPLWTSVKWPNNPNINIRTVSRGINLLALYCTVMSECTVLMTECTVFTCQCTVLMGKHLNVSPGDGLNNI